MCLFWGVKIVKSFLNTGKVVAAILLLNGCSPRFKVAKSEPAETRSEVNYSNLDSWAAHPSKTDHSDSVPQPLQDRFNRDTTVDVFFVHPTSYSDKKVIAWNANIADVELNKKTDRSSILYQASVFNRYNVYAPRYRQAHIFSYYTKDTVHARKALELAYEDVKKAFEYYLKFENKGKPLIIASHSQGTTHTKRLLKEFFEGQALRHQLVAAYIIGIQVEPGYFSELKPCADSIETGCFVSWRTFRRGYEPDYAAAARQSVVTNPLTWTTDTAYAPDTLHRGAVLYKFNEIFPRVNDAQIYKDLLWVSWPDFPGSRLFRRKNYHVGDINLFYMNIRTNVDQRVDAFKKRITER